MGPVPTLSSPENGVECLWMLGLDYYRIIEKFANEEAC